MNLTQTFFRFSLMNIIQYINKLIKGLLRRANQFKLVKVAIVSMLLFSCTGQKDKPPFSTANVIDSIVPTFTHSFRVDVYNGYRILRVFSRSDTISYILCSEPGKLPSGYPESSILPYPAKRITCLSTTQLGAFEMLNARSVIVATANKELICDSQIQIQIATHVIKDAGRDYQPDYEAIVQSKPDFLFSDAENAGASQMFAKMRAMDIKVVACRDYFEQDPLARAEWIRFYAAFIGKEKLADSIFKVIKQNYLQLKYNVSQSATYPKVFCNIPYNGVWYMPCGANYVARFIEDAGGNFLWQEDKPVNGLNLTLNFEQVYVKASNADIWLNPGTAESLTQMATLDPKFKLFKAFKSGMVFNSTGRKSVTGQGLDIWETGPYRPDAVLNDLVFILHHPFATESDLYYYRQLK